MRLGRVCGCWMALACFAPGLPAQSGGVAPEWEVRKDLAALADHVQKLKPVLEQLKPEEWVTRGAPDAYVDQGKRLRLEIDYLVSATQGLIREPERLTRALDTFFRMQSLDSTLSSYISGARRYQNAALADLLQSLVDATRADREKLRHYLQDLAADKEQELSVMNAEAQRCRTLLSKPQRRSAAGAPARKGEQ